MKIKELCSFLEQIAPKNYQESYDNSGLIIGDPNTNIDGVLLCLDSTEEIVDEAIAKGCNLIIAHHPIVFKGLKRFNGKNYVERVVMKAIKNDVAIYAIHTNLDNVLHRGVNSKIAERLGLINPRILAPKKGLLQKLYTYVPFSHLEQVKEALFLAGAGQIGNYTECSFEVQGKGNFKGNALSNPTVGTVGQREEVEECKLEVLIPKHLSYAIVHALQEAHPYEEVAYDIVSIENTNHEVGSGLIAELPNAVSSKDFLAFIKEKMHVGALRYTNIHKEKIQRVALCGGAGGFLLSHAIAQQADIFITADYKYHEFFDAENRIIIADIGHFESEQFTIELFYELITQKFTNFVTYCTEINTNPINYL